MENQTVVTSPRYAINWKDALNGLLMSIGTAILVFLQNSIDLGEVVFDWKKIAMAGLAGAVTYLIKNYFKPATIQKPITNEEAKVLKEELPTTSK